MIGCESKVWHLQSVILWRGIEPQKATAQYHPKQVGKRSCGESNLHEREREER